MELVVEHPSPISAGELVACERVQGTDFGCVWHRHPEFEITWVRAGGSHRWVGDRVTPLSGNDLVLLGPNLPHDFRNEPVPGRPLCEVDALVVQFPENLLGPGWMASMEPVRALLLKARVGLSVSGRTRQQALLWLQRMPETRGLRRVILLLELLDLFSQSTELEPIASPGFDPAATPPCSDRLEGVLRHMERHLSEPLYVEELARQAGLSQSAFTRLFQKATLRTVPRYLNEIRIAHACRLLAETDKTVGEIAAACGYPSAPYFQRQFQRLHGCSPVGYRSRVRSGQAQSGGGR
jgi:AraC-like DNA-binding protein